jgi:hypothetical protein
MYAVAVQLGWESWEAGSVEIARHEKYSGRCAPFRIDGSPCSQGHDILMY